MLVGLLRLLVASVLLDTPVLLVLPVLMVLPILPVSPRDNILFPEIHMFKWLHLKNNTLFSMYDANAYYFCVTMLPFENLCL